MIVYASTKEGFREDVRLNRIEDVIHGMFKRQLGHGTSNSEIESWKNSMQYMSNVLDDKAIPNDTGVAIEYNIPQTSKRIDIVLTGSNAQNQQSAVVVELKQWSQLEKTTKDAVVKTPFRGSPMKTKTETQHPSYQAWTYVALLQDFNETVQQNNISLKPCAYLNNLKTAEVIHHPHYAEHLSKAPAFIRSDAEKLGDFIKQHIKQGDAGKLMFEIDKGRIRPSKSLADTLLSMIDGNQEFIMIDDQKLVYESALELTRSSSAKKTNKS